MISRIGLSRGAVLVLFLGLSVDSWGQDEAFPMDKCLQLFAQNESTRRFSEEEKRITPGSSASAPTITSSVDLIAGDENGRGIISFSGKEQTKGGRTGDWALKVSVPFDKDKKEGIFVSRAGLSGDVIFSGSFSQFVWDLDPSTYGRTLCDACESAGLSLVECSINGLRQHWQRESVDRKEIDRRSNEIEASLFGSTGGRIWGFEGSVGRKERGYFDADAVAQSEDRFGYSLSLVGGVLLQNSTFYGRLTGKQDFKQGDIVTLCTPLEETPQLESCNELPFGEAEETESLVAAVELRKYYKSFAIAPSIEHDFEDSEWTLQLPIFLLRNDKGKLTGGVRLAWESEEEEFGAAIFVTQPLNP